jgi:uncharacterized OB-fold protein
MGPDWFHPVIDVESQPFWDGCRQGRLMIMRCRACERPYFYPRAHCPMCWSAEVEWLEASGRGLLHSYSIVHQFPVEPFAALSPYANIIVALEEGPHMMANWDFGAPLDQMVCDMPVRVGFRAISETLSLPVFGPLDAS